MIPEVTENLLLKRCGDWSLVGPPSLGPFSAANTEGSFGIKGDAIRNCRQTQS
jgi:hypothetical protein